MEYQITRLLFGRLVAQYEATLQSALRDPRKGQVLWQASAPTNRVNAIASNNLAADWLVSYRPRPGFALFGAYGNTLANPIRSRLIDSVASVTDSSRSPVMYLASCRDNFPFRRLTDCHP